MHECHQSLAPNRASCRSGKPPPLLCCKVYQTYCSSSWEKINSQNDLTKVPWTFGRKQSVIVRRNHFNHLRKAFCPNSVLVMQPPDKVSLFTLSSLVMKVGRVSITIINLCNSRTHIPESFYVLVKGFKLRGELGLSQCIVRIYDPSFERSKIIFNFPNCLIVVSENIVTPFTQSARDAINP